MIRAAWSALVLLLAAGCSGSAPPLALAPQVDIGRFMGEWYVVASIPTMLENDAHNAVESYRLAPDGRIDVAFSFLAGGFDGEPRRYRQKGSVVPGTGNAVWEVQFVWPLRADFRIAWLSPDYRIAVIGRERRDNVWILAREPKIADAELGWLKEFVGAQGYDLSRLREVPQRWGRL